MTVESVLTVLSRCARVLLRPASVVTANQKGAVISAAQTLYLQNSSKNLNREEMERLDGISIHRFTALLSVQIAEL